ncbi:MAG: hypothetical protein GY774_35635 [Planctomycetes bacterium]|nr:hypothetical protein [Planctomycetota bacterium]
MRGFVTWLGCLVVAASLVLHLVTVETVDIAGVLFDIGLIVIVIGLGRKIEKE